MKRQPLHNTSNTTSHFIELNTAQNSQRVPIVIRKHSTSKRITLRYQALQHHLLLTLPRYVSIKQGLHFVEEKRKWIEKQIDETVQQFPFKHGQIIPFLGKEYRLEHIGGRGLIAIDGDRITVTGEEAFMQRRVHDWLKQQAHEHISPLARAKAQAIGKQIRGIGVRDTTSRWGSCSHDGKLSFSWRLILAPYEVFDYVISHEVAHLQEFNHSEAFWALVEQLCPGHKRWRYWLHSNGPRLYGYGSGPAG